MKRRIQYSIFFILFLFLIGSRTVFAESTTSKSDVSYVEDEVLIVVDDDTSTKEIKEIVEDHQGTCEDITKISTGEKLVTVKLDEDTDVSEAVTKFNKKSKVHIAQPNFKYKVSETKTNDTSFSSAWHLFSAFTNITNAWDDFLDDDYTKNVKVAIIDSGVQKTHADLSGNIYKTMSIVDGNIKEDSASDSVGHGTHVAGIVAAVANNNQGIAGVASVGKDAADDAVSLLCIKSMNSQEYFMTNDLINALEYIKEEGIKIVNMSLSALAVDVILEDEVEKIANNGILCITAAGNEATDIYSSPSDSAGTLSVISTNSGNTRSYFSNYGYEKEISAPGENILSTNNNGKYVYMSGTSMAAPVVTGVATMMLSVNPTITAAQMKNIIYATATSRNSNKYYGFGIINAKKAVDAAKALQTSSDAPTSIRLNRSSATMYENKSFDKYATENTIDLEAAVYPATTKSVTPNWSSSNSSVASVNSYGKVTAKKAGTATITASLNGRTATCKITVKSVLGTNVSSSFFFQKWTYGEGQFLETDDYGHGYYEHGYKKYLKKGEIIRVINEKSSGDSDPDVAIFNSSKTLVAYSADIGSSNRSAYVTYTAPKAGTYYILTGQEFLAMGRNNVTIMSSRAKPSNVKAKRLNKKKIRLTWKKVNDCNGYQIYRSSKKKSGYKKIKTISKSSTTLIKLKSKKKYYYKIRFYKKAAGKTIYSSYSSAVRK